MTIRLTRRTTLVAGSATLALPGAVRAQPATVKVGLLHPVTGALAEAGQRCRQGGQAAIEDVNAGGGIKAMGGAKLEALLGDTQGRPEIAASLVDQMVEQGAAAFTGGYASPLVLAASQAASKTGTPFVVDTGLADSITTRGLTNVFRLFPNASSITKDAMEALDSINKKAGSPAKTVTIVHEDGEFGTSTAKLLATKLKEIGIELKSSIPHATPTRDFTNIALRIKSEAPDLLMMVNYPGEYVLLARTLVQQRVPFMGMYSVTGGGFNLKFVKEQPTIAEGMMDFNQWYNPKDPKAPEFRKRFEGMPGGFGFEQLFGYFAIKYLLDSIERAGSVDKAKLIEALASSTFGDGLLPYGPTKFDKGQNSGAHGVALQMQGGDMKVVWPEQFAGAAAIFPRPKG